MTWYIVDGEIGKGGSTLCNSVVGQSNSHTQYSETFVLQVKLTNISTTQQRVCELVMWANLPDISIAGLCEENYFMSHGSLHLSGCGC